MDPIAHQEYCPRCERVMRWRWSHPLTKDADSLYRHVYVCPVCLIHANVIFGQVAIFRNHDQNSAGVG